jgi:DNA invertase Pin-like site-specific DNA recombinase
MSRGRKTSLTIHLTPAERQTLLAWQRSPAIPAGRARRGRIVLLLADGRTISDIAVTVGIGRRFVYKWIQRFVQEGLEGLADKRPHQSNPRTPELQQQNGAKIVF